MKINEDDIPQVNLLNLVQYLSHVYHICLKSYKSATGLNSHLRAHERELINQDILFVILVVRKTTIWEDTAAIT